jgi:hypothetical protein
MLTYDTGQSIRARHAGLQVLKLRKEMGDAPTPRYRPTTSRTLSMNNGSRLSFQESCRCGWRANARQIRDTADCDRPSSAASDRVDQCVALAGVLSSVAVMTASTCSSDTVRGRPGRLVWWAN